MPVPSNPDVEDWSDSDSDDDRSDVETNVLLGIPDGAIERQEDLDDAAVSRVGGHPVRPIRPFFTSMYSLYLQYISFTLYASISILCVSIVNTNDR